MVYAKRPFRGPEQVFRYLSRYTHRIAISDSRIIAFDGESVSFRHRKRARPEQRKPCYGTATVSVDEFIRRFLLHVLPAGLHRIRHFGILANGCRARTLESARAGLLAPSPAPSIGGPPMKPSRENTRSTKNRRPELHP